MQSPITEEMCCFLYKLTVYITDGWQAHQNEAVISCMSELLWFLLYTMLGKEKLLVSFASQQKHCLTSDNMRISTAKTRLWDDHPELDVLTQNLRQGPLLQGPQVTGSRHQDGTHGRRGLVERMEKTMNAAVVPKYGGSNELDQPPTIYQVPEELKRGCKQAFVPVAVELGLFAHHDRGTGSEHALQAYKWCCVRRLISRHRLLQEPEQTPALLRRCLNALESLEPRIRSSYHPRQQSYEVANQELMRNMLLDGCFILHRLLKYERIDRREAGSASGPGRPNRHEQEDDDDDWTQLFGRCWVWGFVTCDLLLLENQVPFFVVQKLFEELRTDPDESGDVLVAGALRLFRSIRPQRLQSSHITCHEVHHLLHLFHRSVGLPEKEAAPGDQCRHVVPPSELPQWIPCARELEEAGVKFQARKAADATSFLDVRFHGGVLEIPTLQLCDYSEPLFRNLIAFEQTYPLVPCQITAYAVFMDCLIASPEDMRLLLQQRGVLVNQMSGASERDVAGIFGRLCSDSEAHLASDRNYLTSVIGQVNRYRQSRWPRWRAALVRHYFSNPWVAMSLAAAALLLVLTMIQAFFAAYSYFKPPKQQ